jgi:SAM-dependent methyltransferase
MSGFLAKVKASLVGGLPPSVGNWIYRVRYPRVAHLPIRRVTPLSRCYGLDRGRPVDRYYIEQFLAGNSRYVRGACLEVRDDGYTRRFGGGRVTRVDVLDINPSNRLANIHGDLRHLGGVPDDTYDCVILTQVLQYVDDLGAAVSETHRILKRGGSVLVTVPALSLCQGGDVTDYWRFTPHAIRYLLRQYFPEQGIVVQGHGNALAGVAFWLGLAQEDLRRWHLEYYDPDYACIASARATK